MSLAFASTSLAPSLRRWALPLALLALWQASTGLGLVDPMFLPRPDDVLGTLFAMAWDGTLWGHLLTSTLRILAGFSLAVTLGCLFGLAVHKSPLLARLFDPSLQALRLTPVVAAAPLLILWFGSGEGGRVAIITAMALFPMYLAALAALRAIEPQLNEVVEVLNPSKAWILRHYYLPAALPSILSGARYAMMIAWLSLAVAELIGTDQGIGYLVLAGNSHKNLSLLFVGVLLFALAGKAADSLLVRIERNNTAWLDRHNDKA